MYKISTLIIIGFNLSHQKALREQHDFTDLLQIRYDYDHWSEESLDTLGQLSTPGITRVHGDENTNTVIHHDFNSFKLQSKNHYFNCINVPIIAFLLE